MRRGLLLTAVALLGCPRGDGPSRSPDGATANAEAAAEPGTIRLILYEPSARPAPSEACDVELCTALLELIEGAERSIDFAVYGMRGTPKILDALVRARGRGVTVRGVVDRDLEGHNIYANTVDLSAAIVDVHDDQEADRKLAEKAAKESGKWADREPPCDRPQGFEGPVQCLIYEVGDACLVAAHASREPMDGDAAIMHDKFMVVDGRRVWTGSTNVSNSGVGGYNANLVTVVDSPVVAGWYTEEFEQMYTRGQYHGLKPKGAPRRVQLSEGIELEVLFSPQDRPISTAVRPLLQGAEKRIDIAVFFLTNKHITADLIEAKERGVEVRVVLDATAATNGYTKHELLRAAGIPVKVEDWGGKMHMKSAAIDGRHVVTGSMNWTSAGEFSNDENTIIIHSTEHAQQYHRFYDAMWAGLPDSLLEGRPDPESKASNTACTDGSDNDFDELADAADPGCGDDPPPLPPLPPHALVPKSDNGNCPYWRRGM